MKNHRRQFIELFILFMGFFGEIISECPSRVVKYVKQCPQSEEETYIAEAKSNCKATCNTLKYHCLPDTQMKIFFEVCAEEELIVGRVCAEYNILGLRVQANRHNPKADCANFYNRCPNVYPSTSTYKYKECFLAANDSTIYPIRTQETNGHHYTSLTVILTPIVLITLVGIFIFIIFLRRRSILNDREKRNSQQATV